MVSYRKSYYEIIGVAENASKEDIKKAFVAKTKELHPDSPKTKKDSRIGWEKTTDTEKFMLVKEAYDCLRNDDKRREYDAARSSEGGFLMEASAKTRQMSSSKQNAQRGEWSGSIIPDAKKSRIIGGTHFRNPEEEYKKEKQKNRMLIVISVVVFSVVAANLLYVRKLHSDQILASSKESRTS